MMGNVQCFILGGQPVAVARQQAAKPLPLGKPVPTFGKMECRQLGDSRTIAVARMNGNHSNTKE